MNSSYRIVRNVLFVLTAGGVLAACQPFRNFTTYYNLFYNMERIMGEVEDELLYMREQKTPEPSYYIPYDDQSLAGVRIFHHLDRRSMTPDETKANKIKLDSILLKGSKLLERSAKSDYVPDAVFYIAKTYFYEREWFLSQQRGMDLINHFPESRWYPDAHLLVAMDMMQQGNLEDAEPMISKTIDIAWGRKRKDVLTEAFRLSADFYVGQGDLESAMKPYRRALLLSTDGEERARWQYEIGALYFRGARFEEGLEAFDKVEDYSPDILTQFQTGLQRAVTLRTLGRAEEAVEQIEELADNENFEPWYAMLELEQSNLDAEKPGGREIQDSTIQRIDSMAKGRNYATYGIYERGVRAFRAGDYKTAHTNFVKVQSVQAPFQRRAQRYAAILGEYLDQHNRAWQLTRIPLTEYPDSTKAAASDAYYKIARVFATLGNKDSLRFYYLKAMDWSPRGSLQWERALYAESVRARDEGRSVYADSLLMEIARNNSLSEYADEARLRLNFTDYAKNDPARDAYQSGYNSMRNDRNYPYAISRFQEVIDRYPGSEYAPKAFYAIGLIYEQMLDNRDSAFVYYSQVIDLYPESEQAKEVQPLIEAVIAARIKSQGMSDPSSPREEGLLPLDQPLVPSGNEDVEPATIEPNGGVSIDPNVQVTPPPNNAIRQLPAMRPDSLKIPTDTATRVRRGRR